MKITFNADFVIGVLSNKKLRELSDKLSPKLATKTCTNAEREFYREIEREAVNRDHHTNYKHDPETLNPMIKEAKRRMREAQMKTVNPLICIECPLKGVIVAKRPACYQEHPGEYNEGRWFHIRSKAHVPRYCVMPAEH